LNCSYTSQVARKAKRYKLKWTLYIKAVFILYENNQYFVPRELDKIISGRWGVVAIWVTQPLCPFKVPRRVICSAILASFCGSIQMDLKSIVLSLPQKSRGSLREGCGLNCPAFPNSHPKITHARVHSGSSSSNYVAITTRRDDVLIKAKVSIRE
jgi:hypothetical protein